MKVYIIFWADSFDDWKVVKVLSTKDKAESFIEDKSDSYWYIEEHVY